MSSPVQPEAGAKNLGIKPRLEAQIAVLLAMMLSHFSPAILQAILCRVVRDGQRPSNEAVLDYRRRVVSVSRVCAGEGCLQRSVAVTLLAWFHGYGIAWYAGVKHRPFSAHAWVELDGVPVGETADLTSFNSMLEARPMYMGTSTISDEREQS